MPLSSPASLVTKAELTDSLVLGRLAPAGCLSPIQQVLALAELCDECPELTWICGFWWSCLCCRDRVLPNSTKDTSCVWKRFKLTLTSMVKMSSAGLLRKVGKGHANSGIVLVIQPRLRTEKYVPN
ncbi:hypothetical protein AVEN_189162-1 [Araneus ventricosus]|uniref:Uncharacterized protein n=1 Tax=Araneus ventricosus TaxID=182803 RepID=A0A4Y2W5R4_ARAVE|nr:hypothetical protein AVEN_189162-1 [Araneus ventricosus]